MKQTFEAEFGDFRIAPRQCHITASPMEENAWHVLLFDLECELISYFASPPFPIGKVCVRHYAEGSPHCPNCGYELQGSEIKETDKFTYHGVRVEVIPSYNEDILELLIRYETVVID